MSACALLLSHTLLVIVSCLLCPTQPWAQCCTGSVWVWCLTTSTLKLSISLTASPSCSRLPHPCCTYLLGCWGTLELRFGGTMWRLGMGSSIKVGLRGPGSAFIYCFDCPHCTVFGAVSHYFIYFWCLSGPLHPKHLQEVASGDWLSKEVPRSLG